MAIKIRTSEQTIIDGIANDFNELNGSGIQVQPSTPYAITVYPIQDYVTNVPPLSSQESQVKDGTKGLAAAMVRRIGPVYGSVSELNPNLSFTSATLLSMAVPSMEVARVVQISTQFSAYSNTVDTGLTYWVEVGNVSSPILKFYFNSANVHHSISGSWIMTIPVGDVTINFKVSRSSGSGTINLDYNDIANLTFIG